MAVLSKSFMAPTALQSRATKGNRLGGGAIAGIVLGSLFGLLLILAIVWVFRFRSYIFTNGKGVRASVVDKAEKGHARAKGPCLADQERQFQSLDLQDGAHDENTDLERWKKLESSNSAVSRRSSVLPSYSKHASAAALQPPPYISAAELGPIRIRNDSHQPCSNELYSSINGEPVLVDPKRVLGIDDNLYLDELPFHHRKGSHLTAAPACVASNSKTRVPEASESLGTAETTRLDSLSRWFSSTETDIVDKSEIYDLGVEGKFWQAFERTGWESLQPPKDRTNKAESLDIITHNGFIPGISTVLVPAPNEPRLERDLEENSTEGRTKYCSTAGDSTTDCEVTKQCALVRNQSGLVAGIDPWDVEYRPNPVIFAHLSSSFEATPKRSRKNSTSFATSLTAPASSRDIIGMHDPDQNSFGTHSTLHALESIDTRSSNETVPTPGSSISDVSVDGVSPATTRSESSSRFKGKGRCSDEFGSVELIDFAAIAPSDQPSNDYNDIAVILSSRSPIWTDSSAIAFPLQASSQSPNSSHPSPTLDSTPEKALTSPSVSTEASTESTYSCPICHISFRTPGLRRNHQNRKHNLRYHCRLCESRFGLHADLCRHENTVHRADIPIASTKLFQCPNSGCSAPGKTYARKDNFTRHVGRCKKAIAEANATGMCELGKGTRADSSRHWETTTASGTEPASRCVVMRHTECG